jgi:hypothetical protein
MVRRNMNTRKTGSHAARSWTNMPQRAQRDLKKYLLDQ